MHVFKISWMWICYMLNANLKVSDQKHNPVVQS